MIDNIFIAAHVVASVCGLLLVVGGGLKTNWSNCPTTQISGMSVQLTGIGFLIIGVS